MLGGGAEAGVEGEEGEGVKSGRDGATGSAELATDEKCCGVFLKVADILSQGYRATFQSLQSDNRAPIGFV